MLLKIAEKIIRRNGFEQNKKKPGLSANQAFEQPRSLASVSFNYKHLIQSIRYHEPSKPFRNETQLKCRFRSTQSLRSKYAIIIFICL